ncbi:MAG: hypothetical protein OWQ48_06010 [Desulfurococcus sp.]|nr:hypothetical protein [Desulfurococcus sp.]
MLDDQAFGLNLDGRAIEFSPQVKGFYWGTTTPPVATRGSRTETSQSTNTVGVEACMEPQDTCKLNS